jgi:hypothetical protein
LWKGRSPLKWKQRYCVGRESEKQRKLWMIVSRERERERDRERKEENCG